MKVVADRLKGNHDEFRPSRGGDVGVVGGGFEECSSVSKAKV